MLNKSDANELYKDSLLSYNDSSKTPYPELDSPKNNMEES